MAKYRMEGKRSKIGYTKKRNTPIATLISQYEDKRSGKVMESREEIQWRFDALDWEDQQHILSDFLESGKLDRAWACSALCDLWDPSFEPKIKELWEQYHEDVCKWVVIRHMPEGYIVQHMHEFTGRRDYYYICLRLAQDKNYRIETDKLSLVDYLAVLYHTGRDLDWINTDTIYFHIIHESCLRPLNTYNFDKSFDHNNPTDIPCPNDLRDLGRARYYLRESGLEFPAEFQTNFWTWNEQVKEAIQASEEYQQLTSCVGQSPYFYFEQWMCDIMRKYTYIALPDGYKLSSDPSPDDMVKPQEEYWFGNDFDTKDNPFEGLEATTETDELPFPRISSPEEEDLPF